MVGHLAVFLGVADAFGSVLTASCLEQLQLFSEAFYLPIQRQRLFLVSHQLLIQLLPLAERHLQRHAELDGPL